MVWEGKDAVGVVRRLVGATNPAEAAVAPLFGYAEGRAHDEILDLFGLDPGPFDHFGKQPGQQIIGPHFEKPVPWRVIGSGPGLGCS
jgi:hypothetical protein